MNNKALHKPLRLVRIAFGVCLVVVLIIFLALYILFRFTDFGNLRPISKWDNAKVQLLDLRQRIDEFLFQCHQLPNALHDLINGAACEGHPYRTLVTTPKDLIDPWGNEIAYRLSKTLGKYELISFGADGTEGGVGLNEDLAITVSLKD